MAITGYYLGTLRMGENQNLAHIKKILVLNIKYKCCVNKSCDMSRGQFFFFKS